MVRKSGIGTETDPDLHESRQRLEAVLSLLSDWYWELDEAMCLSLVETPGGQSSVVDTKLLIGKKWSEIGGEPVTENWGDHTAILSRHEAFKDFVLKIDYPDAGTHFIVNAGQPRFDVEGRFNGYRGVTRNITQFWRSEQLLNLEHAVISLLSATDDLHVAVTGVLAGLCSIDGWTCAALWRVLDSSGSLKMIDYWTRNDASHGVRDYFRSAEHVELTPIDDLIEYAGAKGRRLLIADSAISARLPIQLLAEETELSDVLLFPVVWQEKVVALISIADYKNNEPDNRFLQTLTVAAAHLAQYINRKQTEQKLRESEQRFRSLTEFSSDWYWEQDAQFRFVDVAGRNINDPASFLGKTHWDEAFRTKPVNCTWEEHRRQLARAQDFHDLILQGEHNGSPVYYAVSGRALFAEDGSFRGYRGIGKDVTRQREADIQIQFLARHDALTGLPNRILFSETLVRTLHNAARHRHRFALLFIDLDRFKDINDTLGHEAGDVLLKEMARRLTETLRGGDFVARLGGDEFVVLLPEIEIGSEAAAVSRKLLTALTKSMTLQGQECRVTASIGISEYPTDAKDEHALMRNADIAMYHAKEEGKNNFQFFSESLRNQSLERMALESSLRKAIEHDQLLLHYQAKLDLKANRITGVEALLRWQHPDLGMISPAQFIPLAEDTGLIVPIGKWVLKTACTQNVAWINAGLPPVCLAVNLSARQFSDENLLGDIEHALRVSGMPPELLELELTESMVMQNHERAVKVLSELKRMGVRLAIDDFGVGYSSLAQIKNFPIDTLKVDRSFIRDLPNNSEDCAITQAIIAMAKTLSLTVVAEGVETQEQEDFLRDIACDETQGYHFSRPVGSDQFADLLKSNSVMLLESASSARH
jgi:diguanylate cyclase (GGDEF)-like protein